MGAPYRTSSGRTTGLVSRSKTTGGVVFKSQMEIVHKILILIHFSSPNLTKAFFLPRTSLFLLTVLSSCLRWGRQRWNDKWRWKVTKRQLRRAIQQSLFFSGEWGQGRIQDFGKEGSNHEGLWNESAQPTSRRRRRCWGRVWEGFKLPLAGGGGSPRKFSTFWCFLLQPRHSSALLPGLLIQAY